MSEGQKQCVECDAPFEGTYDIHANDFCPKCRDSHREVFDEIMTERAKQDREWGGASHDDEHNSHDWIAYMAKQVGKAGPPWRPAIFRAAMVKAAAIAVAAIRWYDRAEKADADFLRGIDD